MKRFFIYALFIPLMLWSCQNTKRGDEQPSETAEVAELAEVKVHPVQHGSLVLEYKGKFIYIDPVGGAAHYQGYNGGMPHLVLITHPHGDHCDPTTLDSLSTEEATLVLPKAEQAHEKTKGLNFKGKRTLRNGEKMEWGEILVEAVPMYNLPQDSTSRHPKGWGNGYVLDIGGKRVYISGDTEDIPEMRSLKDIDIAFVCMNLPYTMTVTQAVDAVATFKPKKVYPYHYRGKDPKFSDVQAFKEQVNSRAPGVEVILANWY